MNNIKCECCGHEDNRGKMIIMCPICLFNNKLTERKQGALEEQKLFLIRINIKYGKCIFTKDIEERIKELEGCKKK